VPRALILVGSMICCPACGSTAMTFHSDMSNDFTVIELLLFCDKCKTDHLLSLIERHGALILEWEDT
jgi:hypothetical protein